MTTHQTLEPMDTIPRDPHLPPPAVVDWLLEQDWSGMIPITSIKYTGAIPHDMTKSKLFECQLACPVLSEDDTGRILLHIEALEALRKDQSARQAALEEKRRSCDLHSEALAWLQHASNAGCGDLILQHLLQQMKRLEVLEQQRACEAGS